jgi:peptide/nickel transport system substrate-binding protein
MQASAEGVLIMGDVRRLLAVLLSALCAATLLAACSTTGVASAPPRVQPLRGGTVTWAEQPTISPDWIFPVVPPSAYSVVVLSDFIPLMYQSLYNANFNNPTLNYSRSIGNKPIWSDHDRDVTITLKHYFWTNHRPVTARDVVFDINLIRAAGTNWGAFEPGEFPKNLVSAKALGERTILLSLTRSYNPTYFADNWLSVLVPLPQNVWDRESLHGRVGNFDETPIGADKVWSFLYHYSQLQGTYSDKNPIWGVTDGPYVLSSFGGSAAPDVFLPNFSYSGHRSTIAKFEEIPFTSTAAEYNDLRSGNGALTVGYIPLYDYPSASQVRASGYRVVPLPFWGIAFAIPNLKNQALGAVFSQLYIRQTLEHLVNQKAIIKFFFHGLGTPGYGPTPAYPPNNPFLDQQAKHNLYPYSPAAARSLLSSHGWRLVRGVQTCESVTLCGKGVKVGTRLQLQFLYTSGSTSANDEFELYQSDAQRLGIQMTLKQEPYDTVLGIVLPCTPGVDGVTDSSPTCTWQFATWGAQIDSWSFGLFPSGGQLFAAGASGNSASYDNPVVNRLTEEVRYAPTLSAFHQYAAVVARDLPFIWLPMADSIYAVAQDLGGPGTVSNYVGVEPNYWYLKH